MRMTISAAARLYGIHRATLHRHIKSGRLSCVFQPDGSRALDLSELIRCYGEPPNPPEGVRQAATDSATPQTTGDATPANSELIDEIRRQTAMIERMTDRIERLEAALLRLPAPAPALEGEGTPPPSAPTPKATTPPPPKASNPPRDFSDLLARFDDRTRR